jgi:cell volume regulation protein A
MTELVDFGEIVLVVAVGLLLALLSTKLTERVAIPSPVILLLGAALASDVFSTLEGYLSIEQVERLAVVALIVILFDGGMRVGWERFRAAAAPIALLGVLGTFATAALVALFAHAFLGFDWTTAGIIGAALAPTDPAVMFSVLGKREVSGQSGTILEAESGVNDPVGIALLIGMVEFATHDDASAWTVVREFSVEMAAGLAVGLVGAAALRPLMRVSLPSESLYPLRALLGAATIYGVASIAHGSGFLAVFLAGLLLADARIPFKTEIERFHGALASVAEMTVFLALGLTVNLAGLGEQRRWLDGILLALLLAFLARPVVVAALLAPVRLRWGERAFIAWAGLKGAVPILLAAFALLAEVEDAARIYGIVFVVVAFSVLVQGTTVASAARRLGVPIR